MTLKYPSLWDLFHPKRRGRPPGRRLQDIEREIVILEHYLAVAKAHPDWTLSRRCAATHKKLSLLEGFEAPKPQTIRRMMTALAEAGRKELSN
jgi:hypothetical protein